MVTKFKYGVILAMGTLFLTMCAKIYIPLQIPITMHTVAILLIAFLCSRSTAIQIVMLYLILVALGLPVLSSSRSGMTVLFGPTGGYLFGFLLCVHAISMMKQFFGSAPSWRYIVYGIVGTLLILLSGSIWLSYFIGVKEAILKGFVPIVIPGMLKAFFAYILFSVFKTTHKALTGYSQRKTTSRFSQSKD